MNNQKLIGALFKRKPCKQGECRTYNGKQCYYCSTILRAYSVYKCNNNDIQLYDICREEVPEGNANRGHYWKIPLDKLIKLSTRDSGMPYQRGYNK